MQNNIVFHVFFFILFIQNVIISKLGIYITKYNILGIQYLFNILSGMRLFIKFSFIVEW